MKTFALLFITQLILFSCSDNNNQLSSENGRLKRENDSLRQLQPVKPAPVDTVKEDNKPPEPVNKAGVHPISLHWLGWDKPGKATVTPAEDGWYNISGSQLNANREYLNIEGKIRRVSAKELEFTGTVETRYTMNNGGEPCIKKGTQRFYGKGSRTYYRMQDMENCQGGGLVDYVDIYPGTSGL